MNYNIPDALTIQIKKEIADRYFSFRKLIEEDKLDLEEKIRQHSFILEKRISFDLIRIYIMLEGEDLIHSFCDHTGIDKKLFYDPGVITEPAVRDRVFGSIRIRGFTLAGRFENFIFDCYERLAHHTEKYRSLFELLKDQQALIVEEIRLFYRNNDLSAIMGFLQSLGSANAGSGLQGGMEPGMAESLDRKLKIEMPLPIESILPVMPPLPPLSDIRKDLRKIIKSAYSRHDHQFLDLFSKADTPPGRERRNWKKTF